MNRKSFTTSSAVAYQKRKDTGLLWRWPLCGTRACGAVVSAESPTMMVRVVSLIGAAFADGSAAPSLAFEMPWTEKPKPPPELAAAPEIIYRVKASNSFSLALWWNNARFAR